MSYVRYTYAFDQSYCNRRLRHIALDKYSKTNFLFFYFSIPAPLTLDHASRRVSEVSRVSLQTTQSIRNDISIRKLINPFRRASLRTSRKLNGPHTPKADYTVHRHLPSPVASATPNFQLLALSPLLSTRKLAKVAVAVLAENSSLKKIQAITSGSSLEVGGREAGGGCDDGGGRG